LRIQRLESFNEIPGYNSYLVYILTQKPGEDVTVRSMAGLLLKNNIRMRLESFDPDVVAYVQANIFTAIGDSTSMIRNTVSTVIDTLLVELGPEKWTEGLSKLMELADSENQLAQEVRPQPLSLVSASPVSNSRLCVSRRARSTLSTSCVRTSRSGSSNSRSAASDLSTT
jgi:hypothetical protein